LFGDIYFVTNKQK
jgi:hypothetical protein